MLVVLLLLVNVFYYGILNKTITVLTYLSPLDQTGKKSVH